MIDIDNMQQLVHVEDGAVVADSRDVAEAFGRQHKHVLDAIRDVLARRPDLEPTFRLMIAKVATGKGAYRDSHYYTMNRKGFVVLVGGFKGDRALDFRIAFYDAFERLEAMFERMAADAADAIVPAVSFTGDQVQMIDTMHKLTASVSRIQRTHGKAEAMRAWALLGGPDLRAGAAPSLHRRVDENPDPDILAWFSERVERRAGSQVQMKFLFADYESWCEINQVCARGMHFLGRQLNLIGIPVRHSGGHQRQDIKLRSNGVLQ